MPRERLLSEDPSEDFDDEGGSEDLDELSPDEIPGELECANCRVLSTRELFQQMIKKTIDVEPPYQRDVVWTKAAQSSLIDSIFKNKWVPTLLFSERVVACETVDKDGRPKAHLTKKKIWVCMDGKQRLTSIKLFLTGKIPWIRQPGKQWYFKQSNPPSPSRLIISEELQEIFLGRGITTALYHQLKEVQERDIFRLVQEGKPLTIGEKMQAAAGPWGEYFESLRQTYMVRDSDHPNGWCGRVVKMSRGTDFKTMAAMVLLIRDMFRHPNAAPSPLSTVQLQNEMIKLQDDDKVPEKLQEDVKMLLNVFMNITLLAPPNTPHTSELETPEAIFAPIKQGRKTVISPVEMIWIPYLIKSHGRLSIARLLELIELFKVEIRIKYPRDVKDNREVIRFIINWIANVDVRRLTGKYSGFRVPQKPESRRVDPSNSSAAAQNQSGINRAERQDTKVNGHNRPGCPPTAPQGKRNVFSLDNGHTGPTTTLKRPRQSAPHPSNLTTATPQSRPNQMDIPSSAPVTTNGSGASAAPRLTADGTGLNLDGIDPNAGRIGSLFGINTQPQMPSFGTASTQQFGQPSSFAARPASINVYRSVQHPHAATNVNITTAQPSFATARPF